MSTSSQHELSGSTKKGVATGRCSCGWERSYRDFPQVNIKGKDSVMADHRCHLAAREAMEDK